MTKSVPAGILNGVQQNGFVTMKHNGQKVYVPVYNSLPIAIENKTSLSPDDFNSLLMDLHAYAYPEVDLSTMIQFLFDAIKFEDIPKYLYLNVGPYRQILNWRLTRGL